MFIGTEELTTEDFQNYGSPATAFCKLSSKMESYFSQVKINFPKFIEHVANILFLLGVDSFLKNSLMPSLFRRTLMICLMFLLILNIGIG